MCHLYSFNVFKVNLSGKITNTHFLYTLNFAAVATTKRLRRNREKKSKREKEKQRKSIHAHNTFQYCMT